jgi:hypothetical protein
MAILASVVGEAALIALLTLLGLAGAAVVILWMILLYDWMHRPVKGAK